MKKNKFLRLASVMLMLCLITTCAISGTFAKYTESGFATDTARVAAWGVEVTGSFVDDGSAFAETYSSETSGFTGLTVQASEKVMAPGTSGSLAKVEITGTPEVAVQIKYSGELTLTNWTDGTSDYCPVVITVNSVEYKMGAVADDANHVYSTIATFKAAVEAAIADTTAINVAIGSDLDGTQGLEVSWAWAYEDTAVGAYQTDAKDTALTEQNPSLSLKVTVTVDQLN